MKKFLSVFLIFNFLGIISTSCEGCPPEKYSDFRSIKVQVENPKVSVNENLKFAISRDNIIYLTASRSNLNFGGLVYAMSPPCEKGYLGERFSIEQISVKSDRDFSINFPAGTQLNAIIFVYEGDTTGFPDRSMLTFPLEGILGRNIYIDLKPTLSKKHIFTIQLKKSNGEIYQTKTEEITFQ